MISLPALLCLLLSDLPGPIDNCILNRRDVQVSAKFEFREFAGSALPPASPAHELAPGWRPSSEALLTISGRWESDGRTEHLVITQDGIKPGPGNLANPFSFECLFDDDFFAYHTLRERNSIIEGRRFERTFFDLYSPFEWWHKPFPFILKSEYGRAHVTRRSSTVSGRRIETEIYRQQEGVVTVQLVLHYDPGMGFLPRYIRGWSWAPTPGRDRSNVRELYLVSASPCAAGGFVPTEWVETYFAVKNFNPNSPDYSDDMPLRPAGRVSLMHFRITEMRDLKGDVAMDQLQQVRQLASFGGVVKLPPGTARLTLDRIKKLLGKRVDSLRQSAMPPPPARPRRKSAAPALWIVGIFLASAVASVLALRRATALPGAARAPRLHGVTPVGAATGNPFRATFSTVPDQFWRDRPHAERDQRMEPAPQGSGRGRGVLLPTH